MKIGRLEVKATRWPWQDGWGWFPHRAGRRSPGYAMLNQSGARFGGGWRWKLGIAVGGTTVMVDLLFGTVTFRLAPKPVKASDDVRKAC